MTETLIDTLAGGITLPSAPQIDTELLDNIINLWDFSDSAYEVTSVFQNLLSRLPPYFLAYFAISFLFIVIGLLAHLINQIL